MEVNVKELVIDEIQLTQGKQKKEKVKKKMCDSTVLYRNRLGSDHL